MACLNGSDFLGRLFLASLELAVLALGMILLGNSGDTMEKVDSREGKVDSEQESVVRRQ